MFEGRGDPARLSDEALISVLTAATREEAAWAAWRLAVTAEVTARQCADEDDGVAHQVIDGWAFAQAQVGAACNLGARAASKQMRIAAALRDRLPRTGAVFANGALSFRVIAAITWRTQLIVAEEALALVDAAIAASAPEFGALSEEALIRAIDVWVEKFDPAAVIRAKINAKDRYVEFGDNDDPNGVVSFWGRVRATDSEIIKTRVNDLADTVCDSDPRTVRERRADAVAAAIAGATRLACGCGVAECPGSGMDVRSAAVAIYVLTEQVPAAEPEAAAEEPQNDLAPQPETAVTDETPPPTRKPAAQCPRPVSAFGPGVMLGGGVIPAEMIAELIATGAKVRSLAAGADLPAELRHDPSTALTAFVRMRSMTCSFPGCSRPAHRCDLDHLVPWPAGATHPGNLHPLCREHHILKTFVTGPGGWIPCMRVDGTVEWTAPTGHTYATTPGASILFPHWNIHTPAPPPGPPIPDTGADRRYKMPQRQRTRAQDRAQRINTEREHNELELAIERAHNNNDPPF